MGEEKTLLQQIREKEQEFAAKIEVVKTGIDREIEAAQSEAEALLCTADSAGKAEAERLYWEGKGTIEAGIEAMRQEAAGERTAAEVSGKQNISRAVDFITGSVTGE
jgi:vacuolar-type H+-ATPase subunit H